MGCCGRVHPALKAVTRPADALASPPPSGYAPFNLSGSQQGNGSKPEDICLACGLCCDGVIFADLKLQPGDDATPFALLEASPSANPEPSRAPQSARLPGISPTGGRAPKIQQPCIAFTGCSCRIYQQRPKHC